MTGLGLGIALCGLVNKPAILKARSPNLRLDPGKNKSKFDADLRTVGRVESVKTGCIKPEMYDGALPLRERWTSRQILYCILDSIGSQCSWMAAADTMVSWTQTVNQSNSGVDDSLQWRYGHTLQPSKQSVAVVES